MELLSAPQVCRRARISYRQLDYWTRTGIAHPAVEANGSGTYRGWSADEARVLAIVGEAMRLGATQAARAIASHLRAHPDARGTLYVSSEGDVLDAPEGVCVAVELAHFAEADEEVPWLQPCST